MSAKRNRKTREPEYALTDDEAYEASCITLEQLRAAFARPDGTGDEQTLGVLRDWNKRLGGHLTDEEVVELAEDGETFKTEVAKRARSMRATQEARAIVRGAALNVLPLPAIGRTLCDDLAEPIPEYRWTIKDLHKTGFNSLLVAQYKTGKTTLLNNLMKALADEEPFLDVFPTRLTGRVAYFNYELDAHTFREWVRGLGIENQDRIAAPLHLRGYGLPFWDRKAQDELVEWLRANDVGFIIIDPVARAWLGLVENENDNSGVSLFADAVDQLKRRSGVADAVLAAHTGRAEQVQDDERSRGATRLQDWMDAGWYLTKDPKTGSRSLRAEGRDVDVSATILHYDNDTRSLSWTGETRQQHRAESGAIAVLAALRTLAATGRYPTPGGELRDAIQDLAKEARGPAIQHAIDQGWVTVKPGAKNAKLHSLTKKGRRHLEQVEASE